MIGGACVLVVEDDAAINKVVCSYLGKLGAECVPAFSGTEGPMHLEGERRFDLLITDLMLPGAPGEEVVAAARARHVPIIVLSARATVADRVDLLRLGADDYLVKPFDLEELAARCEAVLRRVGGEVLPALAETAAMPTSGIAPPPLHRTGPLGPRRLLGPRMASPVVQALTPRPRAPTSVSALVAGCWTRAPAHSW